MDELYLDPGNVRLVEADAPSDQLEILRILWNQFAVDEIALSIAANGYFPHEPLFADREDGRLVVIEGNRRLAAVKLLVDPGLRKKIGATGLPEISPAARAALQRLPVIECKRGEIWQYVGFKHVNGPQQWQSYSKAQYIGWVRNKIGRSLEQIAQQIGDQHSTVARLYRALMVLEQAENAGVFGRQDRFKRHFSFSHLYTGLDYPGIQSFLGISRNGDFAKRKPVPAKRIRNLGELCIWLYGSKSKDQPAVVTTQNPDLRILAEVVNTKDGIAALRRGLPLKVARDISKGDAQLFREAIVGAKQSLQEARGKLLTGYRGERDLLDTAREIRELASNIHEEMQSMRRKEKARDS